MIYKCPNCSAALSFDPDTNHQFECSETAMQAAIKQLKSNKGISGK